MDKKKIVLTDRSDDTAHGKHHYDENFPDTLPSTCGMKNPIARRLEVTS